MSEDIDDFIKPVKNKDKLVTHKVTDLSLGLKNYRCSTFIERENIVVKGEWDNEDESRKALVVFFDSQTGKFVGQNKMF